MVFVIDPHACRVLRTMDLLRDLGQVESRGGGYLMARLV